MMLTTLLHRVLKNEQIFPTYPCGIALYYTQKQLDLYLYYAETHTSITIL
jgi:hypothetical protein